MRVVPSRLTQLAMVVVLLGGSSAAQALGLLADERYVRRFGESEIIPEENFDETDLPPAPFALFASSGSWATQQSSAAFADGGLTMVWTASGFATAYVDSELFVAGGQSRFRIGFRIDGEGSVDLSGLIRASGGQYNCCTHVTVDLVSESGTLFHALAYDSEVGDPPREVPIDFQAALPAGEYWIDVFTQGAAFAFDGSDGTYDVRIDVSDTLMPIPEAGTALLVLTGTAALAGRRFSGPRGPDEPVGSGAA